MIPHQSIALAPSGASGWAIGHVEKFPPHLGFFNASISSESHLGARPDFISRFLRTVYRCSRQLQVCIIVLLQGFHYKMRTYINTIQFDHSCYHRIDLPFQFLKSSVIGLSTGITRQFPRAAAEYYSETLGMWGSQSGGLWLADGSMGIYRVCCCLHAVADSLKQSY
jgi:hypothetical protein